QPTALQSVSGVLLLALLDKEHEAGGDARTAQQTACHIQPAQGPVFEVLQVQAGQELIDGANRISRRVFSQQLAGTGLEVNALPYQRHTIAAGAVDADVAVGVIQMLDS